MKKLLVFFRKRPKISIIIPFSSNDPQRKANLKWLLKYWKCKLPYAEVIVGRSKKGVFCKGAAINDAVRRSSGKVLAVLDADAYLDHRVVRRCANRILEELSHGHHLWYVPYRHLYRLRKGITRKILKSDPCNPLKLPEHPCDKDASNKGHQVKYGHRYAAMAAIFPREAYDIIGGCDERFRGWGGEDVALLRALDTLWGRHKTTNNSIYHLWHSFIGNDYKTRRWEGQDHGNANQELANAYNRATNHPQKMRDLIKKDKK